MRLKDKVVYITGGGDGMGRSIAILAAKEGAQVAIADIREDMVNETMEILNEMGAEALGLCVDISDSDALTKSLDETVEKFGKIDVLVNNAGYSPCFCLPHEVPNDKWDRIMDVNVKAPFVASKHVVPAMMERKNGVIINITSTSSIHVERSISAYCVSKAAMAMLTKTFALEYAPYNIRVNSVSPGVTLTTMMKNSPREVVSALEATIPMGRLGMPEDIAKTVIYLASDDAAYVTGQEWGVDGGLPMV